MSTAVGKNLHIGEHDESRTQNPLLNPVLLTGIFIVLMALVLLILMSFIIGSNTWPPDWNVVLYS